MGFFACISREVLKNYNHYYDILIESLTENVIFFTAILHPRTIIPKKRNRFIYYFPNMKYDYERIQSNCFVLHSYGKESI